MSYCSTLKDFQVVGVLVREAKNVNTEFEYGRDLYYEAREECARRGMDPDGELRDAGIHVPK